MCVTLYLRRMRRHRRRGVGRRRRRAPAHGRRRQGRCKEVLQRHGIRMLRDWRGGRTWPLELLHQVRNAQRARHGHRAPLRERRRPGWCITSDHIRRCRRRHVSVVEQVGYPSTRRSLVKAAGGDARGINDIARQVAPDKLWLVSPTFVAAAPSVGTSLAVVLEVVAYLVDAQRGLASVVLTTPRLLALVRPHTRVGASVARQGARVAKGTAAHSAHVRAEASVAVHMHA